MSEAYKNVPHDELGEGYILSSTLGEKIVEFRDVRTLPVDFYGLYKPLEAPFRRLPEEVSGSISDKCLEIGKRTPGCRIRFKTDSDFVAVRVVKPVRAAFIDHMTHTGSSGMDIYEVVDGVQTYLGVFCPPVVKNNGYELISRFGEKKERDLVLYFPLYDQVTDLYLGLAEGATLTHGGHYKYETPVVFYGSSIVEGCGASRPGIAYSAQISRMLNTDFYNMGFGGNAFGEKIMAEYIAGMDMSVFVLDYDHNSSVEELAERHYAFYKTIRDKRPEVPIIMLSRVSAMQTPDRRIEVARRKAIIAQTYARALSEGDQLVSFIDGSTIFDRFGGADSTVDGTHPSDLGYYAMAHVIAPYIKLYLEKKNGIYQP